MPTGDLHGPCGRLSARGHCVGDPWSTPTCKLQLPDVRAGCDRDRAEPQPVVIFGGVDDITVTWCYENTLMWRQRCNDWVGLAGPKPKTSFENLFWNKRNFAFSRTWRFVKSLSSCRKLLHTVPKSGRCNEIYLDKESTGATHSDFSLDLVIFGLIGCIFSNILALL